MRLKVPQLKMILEKRIHNSNQNFSLILFFLISMSLPTAFSAPTILRVQDVISATQTQNLNFNDINYNFQRAELLQWQTEANYDTSLFAKIQNEDSRLEVLGVPTNLRDQTQSWVIGANRKWSSGSTLGLDYSYIHRDSDLSAAALALSTNPIQYYHLTTLSFKQDLLNNSFGYRDRRILQSAQFQLKRAQLERDEAVEELTLQTIKLFLDTYFSQENLKQSLAARDKYILLVKSIQQKNKMGFDDRSELIKTKAELQNQERNVKSASLTYLNLLNKLYTTLNLPRPGEVELEIPESVITAPASTDSSPSVDSLRKSQSLELLVKSTEAEREASINNESAGLNFFAQAAYSGLDSNNSSAVSEMNQHSHPKYTMGLEFTMKWGGSAQKAESLSKKIVHEEALNNQRKVQNDLQETIERTERNLKSKYIIAVNAQETVKIWEEAMKSQELNHRFGRITTSELILDYTNYFRSKSSLSGALADYQMSLYEYQAARDELIHPSNK